jgi:ribonuclease D
LARTRDVAPARILPDSAIVAAATADPKSIAALRALPIFGGPRQRRYSRDWLGAVERARALPDSELPSLTQPFDGPPPVNRWERRDPDAAARLAAARASMSDLSARHSVPVENLLTPDLLRRLCWDGLPEFRSGATPDNPMRAIDDFLAAGGARPWQRELAGGPLAAALFDRSGEPAPVTDQS